MTPNQTLHIIFTFFFGIFGSLLGSFSNVVILRMAEKTSVIFPPSSCPKCKHRLTVLDLVPVFSWLFLLGKCRYCSCKISWQYPLVEASIATILGCSFYFCGFSPLFIPVASISVIWFVASVIFLRNEVNSPQPFLWPIAYLLLFTGILNFPASLPPKHLIFLPLFVALMATFKQGLVNWSPWLGLSILCQLRSSSINVYLPAILLIPAFLNNFPKLKAPARIIFFVFQLGAIGLSIYKLKY